MDTPFSTHSSFVRGLASGNSFAPFQHLYIKMAAHPMRLRYHNPCRIKHTHTYKPFPFLLFSPFEISFADQTKIH